MLTDIELHLNGDRFDTVDVLTRIHTKFLGHSDIYLQTNNKMIIIDTEKNDYTTNIIWCHKYEIFY